MRTWLFILLVFGAKSLEGQSANELFEAGNEAYQQKEFGLAEEKYQAALQTGKVSAALYYNLANTFYKQNQLAEAILNYERALLLQPGDEEILHNLHLAEQKTIDRFETLPRTLVKEAYLKILLLFTVDNWARLGIWLFSLMMAGTGVYFFTSFRRIGFISALAGLVFGSLSLALAYAQDSYRENNREAIVMVPSTYVKSGPAESAEDSFILHEGTKATVIEEFEGWQKIRLPDGKLGWVPAQDIEFI